MTKITLWTPEEWLRMRKWLETLDTNQLKELAIRTGISFTDGMDSLKDRLGTSVKEQLILVLDEVEPNVLSHEYTRLANTPYSDPKVQSKGD